MKNRADMAQELIQFHTASEDAIVLAFRYERMGGDLPQDALKLLEVSNATVAAGVAPVYFGATPTIPIPVVIIELTESEFTELEAGTLCLPEGWDQRAMLHALAA